MTTPEQRKTQTYGRDRIGSVLAGRYRILQKLGEGGMGTVYLAEHTTIGKKVAAKLLAPEYCHRPELVERFLQEARAASKVQQENVVEITDYGETQDGSVFLVMEYLRGEDLATTLRRDGPLAWARVRTLAIQIARALQAAHEAGIVHRDMKPENCFRVPRADNPDYVKVLDFGIAKVLHEEVSPEDSESDVTEASDRPRGLTRTGMIMGTPEYMSPEQASGIDIDHRADIYAVGVIMYELLTGRVPFSGKTFMAILQAHMFETAKLPRDISPYGDLPADAEAVVLKALQKDRELRFQTMQELITAIERVGTGAPPVDVIDERPTLPSQPAMSYIGTGPSSTYREAPTLMGEPETLAARASRRRWILGAALAMAAAGFGAWSVADPGAPTTAPAPVQTRVEEPAPAAGETPDPLPAPVPAMVTLAVTTPVPAMVLDADDGSVYGVTNGEPIEFSRSDRPIRLLLRASGYEDATFEFRPTQSLRAEKLLTRNRARKGGKAGGRGDKAPVATATEPTPVPAVTGPAEQPGPKVYESPELLNPFKNKKHKKAGGP